MPPFEDQLSKYLFGSLLADIATVEAGSDLLPESFRVDVLFVPHGPLPSTLPGAGKLAQWVGTRRCVVEAFSGTVRPQDLRSSIAKLHLALWRGHKDGLGPHPLRGCLCVITIYWPHKVMQALLGPPDAEPESGIRVWHQNLETIYIVNASQITLNDDTVLFRLLSKGKARKEAVLKIFQEDLEPYVTLLNDFDLRFKKMAVSDRSQQIDPRLFEDLQELRDTREEVLRELGLQEGEKRLLAQLLRTKFPEVAAWETLLAPIQSSEYLEQLGQAILQTDDAQEMLQLVQQAVNKE